MGQHREPKPLFSLHTSRVTVSCCYLREALEDAVAAAYCSADVFEIVLLRQLTSEGYRWHMPEEEINC